MNKISVVTTICAAIFSIVCLQCKPGKPADPRGELYAGASACAKCHSGISSSFLHTAHYIASGLANANTVHGRFSANSNFLDFSPSQRVVMENRDSGLFQTYYLNGKVQESHRFDIVLGGVKGESYLYWKGNGLNQLPVSYYTKLHQWLLSPRFDPRYVNFNRTITSRCMECHAAYIEDQPGDAQRLNAAEQFDKNTLVYSIDCERCHGPGARHVNFQTDNPGLKTAKFITSLSSLPRGRRMDACAVCHSGNRSEMLKSTFRFSPGDTLANFKLPGFKGITDTARLDVHGNQVQLLESSKCFIYSKMDCSTCHNTHENQRGNTTLFIQKCLSCHSTIKHNYCKLENQSNARLIKSNCIQCHMPALASRAIVSTTTDKASFSDILVHTHHIAIYPEEVKKILTLINR